MTKVSLLALALAVGSVAACAQSDRPRAAAAYSGATYYGPSAASWAPEAGTWQPPRRAAASNNKTS